MKILIINGPNLNMLGIREKSIYGDRGFDDYLVNLQTKFLGTDLVYFQSNSEGELVSAIQRAYFDKVDAIVINAGAYTHTSIAIRDALLAVKIPFVEVHISNVFAREEFRHKSYLSDIAMGVISGFGLYSYDLAIEVLIIKLKS